MYVKTKKSSYLCKRFIEKSPEYNQMKRIFVSFLLLAVMLLSAHAQKFDVTRTRILIDDKYTLAEDDSLVQFLAPYKAKVDSIMSPVLGMADHYMSAGEPEGELGNLLADVLMWAAPKFKEKPDFAIYNQGGIRAAMKQGPVTVGDINDIAPFENKITFLTLTGEDVLNLMSEISHRYGACFSHGFELVIKANQDVVSVKLNGKPINPKRKYRIVTLDYLAQGNDGMVSFKKKTNVKAPSGHENNVRYIIMDYVRKHKTVSSCLEGRLRFDDPAAMVDDGKIVVAPKRQPLVILHTNDTHSTIEPLSDALADTLRAGRGGYLRRAAMIRQERQANPGLLLFDSGDFSQGSAYYSIFHGDVEVELMNKMGYDAATIGNHEFDFGLENMARLFRKAQFPIVCANYDFTGTPCEGLVRPYIVKEVNGRRVGIFGICPEMKGLVFEANCKGVGFSAPAETANAVVKTLRNDEHCDVVICLSHLGWTQDGDINLIKHTSGIDLVLGGHTHTNMKREKRVADADGNIVVGEQNGKHAIYVGKVVVE